MMNDCLRYIISAFLLILCTAPAIMAAPFSTIEAPPLSDRWFGIYVNGDRVGFYRQRIEKADGGYRFEGNGSVRMTVMSFTKEASMRETYLVTKKLALRSCDVDQTINGSTSHVSGTVVKNTLQLKNSVNGTVADKTLKFKGEIYPGPALNLYPLMHGITTGTSYRIQAFDPEELKIKDVQISVLGDAKTSDGQTALKLRNNLYPFVNNDIWVDHAGNTLEESVRDGLVTTVAEQPDKLGSFISDWAVAKKDLIFDFSLIREQPPLKNAAALTGLAVEISGWNEALPLLQGGTQLATKSGTGKVIFKTGALVPPQPLTNIRKPAEADLKPADKIESEAPEIKSRADALAIKAKTGQELVRALAAWTAEQLQDSLDDGGGALASLTSKRGNCQTHARLYTALARAAGIPTRFVSGLVYLEGKGFLYHSWAESYIGERWITVDPTFNQIPADPTHIKLLEGHLPDDMAPIIAIIGQIRMNVVETAH